MSSAKTFTYMHDVPIEYIRTIDAKLLPPRVGHNWLDPAFRKKQDKPQQLEAEFRGKRAFVSRGIYDNTPPEGLGLTAKQLINALSTRRANTEGAQRATYTTLDDKILRFYAFFTERAPEGCREDYRHRRVVINFYPENDTVLIQEPRIPNSGMLGGVYLKRQQVRADPRQLEEFPDDEFLTINHFNVGRSVRINAVEFFLYDCDPFTREFLTALGVSVGEPMLCPDDAFMTNWRRTQERMLSGRFGILSQDYHGEEAVRSARFVQDSGKVLRFYGLFGTRTSDAGDHVRKLELMYFVEDDSIAVVERPTTNEAIPSLFLSRCWLPRNGSIAMANELTFAHRVNGMREPYIGPDGYYTAADLDIGITINLLGRRVLLYDCDLFTREFYRNILGVNLREAVDCEKEYGIAPESHVLRPRPTAIPASRIIAQGDVANQPTAVDVLNAPANEESLGTPIATATAKTKMSTVSSYPGVDGPPKEVLRFLLRLSPPCSAIDRQRRFTLAYYLETDEVMVHETPLKNSGYVGGCFCRRQRLIKPPATPDSTAPVTYYTSADIRVGGGVVVNSHRFDVVHMDERTANFLEGRFLRQMTEDQLQRLVAAFRLFLSTRYHACRDAFLAFDRDKDGVVSVTEFVAYLKELQIVDRTIDAEALFNHINPVPEAGYLTVEDMARWVSETSSDAPTGRGEIDVERRATVRRSLRQLCERLEARCMNSGEMFRLASTMPRAYAQRRADIFSLTNPQRDAVITPVQMRRCVEEVLGGMPAPVEMDCILEFFFPRLPPAEYRAARDTGVEHGIDLKEFQSKYHAMVQLRMLPETRR